MERQLSQRWYRNGVLNEQTSAKYKQTTFLELATAIYHHRHLTLLRHTHRLSDLGFRRHSGIHGIRRTLVNNPQSI